MNAIRISDEVFQRLLSDDRREDDQEMRKNVSHLISPVQVRFDLLKQFRPC